MGDMASQLDGEGLTRAVGPARVVEREGGGRVARHHAQHGVGDRGHCGEGEHTHRVEGGGEGDGEGGGREVSRE